MIFRAAEEPRRLERTFFSPTISNPGGNCIEVDPPPTQQCTESVCAHAAGVTGSVPYSVLCAPPQAAYTVAAGLERAARRLSAKTAAFAWPLIRPGNRGLQLVQTPANTVPGSSPPVPAYVGFMPSQSQQRLISLYLCLNGPSYMSILCFLVAMKTVEMRVIRSNTHAIGIFPPKRDIFFTFFYIFFVFTIS